MSVMFPEPIDNEQHIHHCDAAYKRGREDAADAVLVAWWEADRTLSPQDPMALFLAARESNLQIQSGYATTTNMGTLSDKKE